jgi:tRNA-splicing ligase RtcB (3'-phosphate/5'-hydroxy nucleic acid ligase)
MKIWKRDDYRVPVFSWCSDIEESAMVQIDNLARLPFVVGHVAVMPDCHAGYGMPIGGVIACDGVVIPNAVGVDIGCGMLAVKTNIGDVGVFSYEIRAIVEKIRERVPVGFKWHEAPVAPYGDGLDLGELPVVSENLERARLQLGTLGGGNHFVELQKDSDGVLWFMIHSGSRNLGKQVADHYNRVAKDLNAKWCSSIPKEWYLAFLPTDSPEAELYLREMQCAVDFALYNRQVMADIVKEVIVGVMEPFVPYTITFKPPINIAHNYAAWEEIHGKRVLVHRKGATAAHVDQLGIIPGSQGTASYIVRGRGNVKSFYSCSHGAGRKMGRKEAQRTLNLDEEIKRLDNLGVVHGVREKKDLDEAAGAYKDIGAVMDEQKDLVRVVTELVPLGVVKG